MSTGSVAAVNRLLDEAADALDAVVSGAGANELIAALVASERMARRMDRAAVTLVAALDRQGVLRACLQSAAGARGIWWGGSGSKPAAESWPPIRSAP